MGAFSLFVGIDYSGAETPTSRLPGLRAYAARPGETPEAVTTPAAVQSLGKTHKQSLPRYWTRAEIAHWIIALVKQGEHALIGIDHGFSFPDSYFKRYGLESWDSFLADFCRHWPTDHDHVYVDFVRHRVGSVWKPGMETRVGNSNEFRLSERWTSSARSVFQFDVTGQVAKSTHAGIPWLARIRAECGNAVHFWPFDGWAPPAGKAVIAEVYPSIFRKRYSAEDRGADAQDAYAVARWLAETSVSGHLERYFEPPLTAAERELVGREGWILGVT